MYVPLCCFHQESRGSAGIAASSNDCSLSERDGAEGASLIRPREFMALLRENLREQFSSPAPVPTHTCPHSPELIRTEVEELKTNFNRRIKEVLFNSLFSAYYVAFLPLCFVKVSCMWWWWWFIYTIFTTWIMAVEIIQLTELLNNSPALIRLWIGNRIK